MIKYLFLEQLRDCLASLLKVFLLKVLACQGEERIQYLGTDQKPTTNNGSEKKKLLHQKKTLHFFLL